MRCFSGEGNSLFSHSVMSDSLRPHRLQLPCTRLPCSLLSPWVCSNSCPLSQWSHPTTSSSVIPFSYSQLPASGSFPMNRLFTSGGQSIGSSASASVLPMNIQFIRNPNSFRIDWFDLLAVKGTCKSLLQHHNSKASILRCSAFFMVQLSHPYMTTGKTIALTRQTILSV